MFLFGLMLRPQDTLARGGALAGTSGWHPGPDDVTWARVAGCAGITLTWCTMLGAFMANFDALLRLSVAAGAMASAAVGLAWACGPLGHVSQGLAVAAAVVAGFVSLAGRCRHPARRLLDPARQAAPPPRAGLPSHGVRLEWLECVASASANYCTHTPAPASSLPSCNRVMRRRC